MFDWKKIYSRKGENSAKNGKNSDGIFYCSAKNRTISAELNTLNCFFQKKLLPFPYLSPKALEFPEILTFEKLHFLLQAH